MIKKPAILIAVVLLFGCSSSNEERQRIPDNTYRPSGFHAFINHGTDNSPVSLTKTDSLYHLFYTTGTDEWGHIASNDLLSWRPEISFPIKADVYGEVIWDANNQTGLNAPWNLIESDGEELSLSFSNDALEWVDYDSNPIAKVSGLPSINWSSNLELWILTSTAENEVSILTSQNLTDWKPVATLTTIDGINKSTLISQNGAWFFVLQGASLYYQSVSFDGQNLEITGDPFKFEGISAGLGSILNTSEENIFIANSLSTNDQLPTFTSPMSFSHKNETLGLIPSPTFQSQLVGKRRAKLSKLFTDGPSWYHFTVEESFEEMEIVISDESSNLKFVLNKSNKSISISGSSLAANETVDQYLNNNIVTENFDVDILIDHASVDVFLNDGAYSTNILSIPDSFFSKVEIYLDGKKYDARGVLYDIGI